MGTLTQMSIRAASDLLENHYGGLLFKLKIQLKRNECINSKLKM